MTAKKEFLSDYSFTTRWRLESPPEKVWEAIYFTERWPQWWRGVERVQEIRPATGPHRTGSVRRFTWKSALPYRLTFDMAVTRVEPLRRIESTASGELAGTGVWTFSREGRQTRVRYDWNVYTTLPWMNALAPVARPLFRWNHDVVMEWGFQGLKQLLKG